MKLGVALFSTLVCLTLAGCGSHRLAPVVDLEQGGEGDLSVQADTDAGVVAASGVEASGDVLVTPLPEQPITGTALGEAAPTAVAPASAALPQPVSVGLNPAVIALLNQANVDTLGGRHDQAAANLERALKIEPRNAWLWHRLGRTRLVQGEWELAQSLAARSNSYAAEDRQLLADNWALIAEARRLSGDTAGANAAALRAAEFADS